MAKEAQACEFHSGAAFSCLWHALKFFEDPLPWANQPQETSEWLMQLRQIGSCPGATRPEAFVVRATWGFIFLISVHSRPLISTGWSFQNWHHHILIWLSSPFLCNWETSHGPSSVGLQGLLMNTRPRVGRGARGTSISRQRLPTKQRFPFPWSLQPGVAPTVTNEAIRSSSGRPASSVSLRNLREVPPCKSRSPFLNEHGTRSQDPGSRPSSATY